MKSKYRIKRLYRIIFSLLCGTVFCFSSVPSFASSHDVDFGVIADVNSWSSSFEPTSIKGVTLRVNELQDLTTGYFGSGSIAQSGNNISVIYPQVSTINPAYLGFMPYEGSPTYGYTFTTRNDRYYLLNFDIEYSAGSVLRPATTDLSLCFCQITPSTTGANTVLVKTYKYGSYKVSQIDANRFRYHFAVNFIPDFEFSFWGIALGPLNTTGGPKSYGVYYYNIKCEVLTAEQWLIYQLQNPDATLSTAIDDADTANAINRDVLNSHNDMEDDYVSDLEDSIDTSDIFSSSNFLHKLVTVGSKNISFGKSFLDVFYGLNDGVNPWSTILFFAFIFAIVRLVFG